MKFPSSLRCLSWACLSLVAVAVSLPSGVRAAERDLEKEFRTAQRSIQAQMKNKNREQRVAAVKKLEAYPVVDAGKLLVVSGLGSGDDDVRRASYEVLLKFKDDAAIGNVLAQAVDKDLKRGAVDEATCGAMGVLLSSKNAELEKKADQLLLQAASITTSGSGLLLLVTVADELGTQATEESRKSLLKRSKLPLFAKNLTFRRAVTHGLMRVREVDAGS